MAEFILSGFSDEIAADFQVQLEKMQELDIANIEIRGVNGKNISELTLDEAREVKKLLDEKGMKVSSIGSPIGKIKITDPFEPHMETFQHLIEIAEILQVKNMRIFSFYIENETYEEYEEKVFSRMKALLDVAKAHDMILLHENEKGIYGDIPARCKKLYDHMGDENFKLIFDPANFVQCGVVTYPEAFQLLKDGVVYMHIKDALLSDGQVVPSGYGDGHVPEIIKELGQMNYKGYLSLEPHLGYFEGFDALEENESLTGGEQGPLVFKENSDAGKFELAVDALRKILKENGYE